MKLRDLIEAQNAVAEIGQKTDLPGNLHIQVFESVYAFQDAIKPFQEFARANQRGIQKQLDDIYEKNLPRDEETREINRAVSRSNNVLEIFLDKETAVKFDPIPLSVFYVKESSQKLGIGGLTLAHLKRIGMIK